MYTHARLFQNSESCDKYVAPFIGLYQQFWLIESLISVHAALQMHVHACRWRAGEKIRIPNPKFSVTQHCGISFFLGGGGGGGGGGGLINIIKYIHYMNKHYIPHKTDNNFNVDCSHTKRSIGTRPSEAARALVVFLTEWWKWTCIL